jgi:serine/threonine protein kinase
MQLVTVWFSSLKNFISNVTLRISHSFLLSNSEVSYSSIKYVDQDTPFNENKSVSCFPVTIGKSKQRQALKLYKDPVDPKTFWMEVLFLRRLHHPNVANLKGHIFSDNHSGVIVEYSDYGTLFDLLHMDRFKQFRPLPLELQLHFAKEIALGLDYLRGLGVIHKRLRSSNIVVKSIDLAPGNHVILSDFGASQQEADHDARTKRNDCFLFYILVLIPNLVAPMQFRSLQPLLRALSLQATLTLWMSTRLVFYYGKSQRASCR